MEKIKTNIQDKFDAKPFVKWAGGKTWLISQLNKYLPTDYRNYFEPFLGGGAVFFSLDMKGQAYLSDTNEELINVYNQLRNNLSEVLYILDKFINEEVEYYNIRSQPKGDPIYEAAKFIFLNKTCFNGLYRVNSRGMFNVPYGRNPNTRIYETHNMELVFKKLQTAKLFSCDFEESLNQVEYKDLVFLDPPYTVSHNNNGFIEYNKKLFRWEDQQRLATIIEQLHSKGAYFILTNAVHNSISELYGNIASTFLVERNNTMAGNSSKRGKTSEYIFTNCI